MGAARRRSPPGRPAHGNATPACATPRWWRPRNTARTRPDVVVVRARQRSPRSPGTRRSAARLDRQHQPGAVAGHTEHVHTGDIEQGIGASTPTHARTARTVIHVGAFISIHSLVATDLEGPDPSLPPTPRRRRTRYPRLDPKTQMTALDKVDDELLELKA